MVRAAWRVKIVCRVNAVWRFTAGKLVCMTTSVLQGAVLPNSYANQNWKMAKDVLKMRTVNQEDAPAPGLGCVPISCPVVVLVGTTTIVNQMGAVGPGGVVAIAALGQAKMKMQHWQLLWNDFNLEDVDDF